MLLSACCQNMEHQPRYEQYEPAGVFRKGRVLQATVPGTVAGGDLARDAEKATRPPLTAALLLRGQDRYNVFCSPCHACTGDGGGMVVQRGMLRPPSFHIARLREASDQHFFDAITNGYGVM
jgi:hypothetical protein